MKVKYLILGLLSGIILSIGTLVAVNKTVLSGKSLFDGFSSATPVAIHQRVPTDATLLVSGQVEQNWTIKPADFNELAQTRIRCAETERSGTISGAYIYQGVPLLHILEGVRPVNRPADPFDRPLDMIVWVQNQSGKSSWFSYGELTMCDDADPVILAFDRQELLPTKDPENYSKNAWHGPHRGLRLVAARDRDNSRFIDEANEIRLLRPKWPTPQGTPTMADPGKEAAIPDQLVAADGRTVVWQGRPDSFDLQKVTVVDWRRIGHGRGLKSTNPEEAQGYRFSELLTKLFPNLQREDAVLLIAIDGYRSLFSGREILEHRQSQGLLIQEAAAKRQGWCVLATGDFFVDRCIWGVSHIIRVSAEEIEKFHN